MAVLHGDPWQEKTIQKLTLNTILLAFSIAKSVGDIMSVGLFFQLLVCAVSLAVYMVGMESNGLSVGFFVSAIGLTDVILSTYALCFLSEYVTHNLSIVGDYFYNCAWYCFSIKHQRLWCFLYPFIVPNCIFVSTALEFSSARCEYFRR